MTYPELGAVVQLGPVPYELLDELPGLYSSLRSTRAWFAAFDQMLANGVCILSNPRHVLVFTLKNDTVKILNKGFVISSDDTRRACQAIFAALPEARRIRIEVPFAPRELLLPHRVLDVIYPLVIDLPDTVEGYYASLGSRTRKNVRNFQNRLRSSYPDVKTEVQAPDPNDMRELVEQFITWNIRRMRAGGHVSSFEKDKTRRSTVTELMLRGGAQAVTTTIDGRLAAVEFVHYVGNAATIYAGAFDDQYADVHLGFLSTYWAICETARGGARQCHLLWTGDYYKGRLGAHPSTASQLSVFRTEAQRFWAFDEVREIGWRRCKEKVRSLLRIG